MSERVFQIAIILFVGIVTILQGLGWISVSGIKVNLILVAIVTLSFFIDEIGFYSVILLITGLIAPISSGLSKEFIAIVLVGAFAFLLKRKFLSPSISTNAIAIAICAVLFYLIISPSILIHTIFFQELIFNEIAGLLIFLAISRATGINYKKLS